jgi:hypothetical protein
MQREDYYQRQVQPQCQFYRGWRCCLRDVKEVSAKIRFVKEPLGRLKRDSTIVPHHVDLTYL